MIGLEQEFFIVDGRGVLRHEADSLLLRCRELARSSGLVPESFKPECARGLVEICTAPHTTFAGLACEYLALLRLAIRAGQDLGLRLCPLGTYPLLNTPRFREDPRYRLKALTIGSRFVHAGRCAGVHLHIEIPSETLDRHEVISRRASAAARREVLALYNLVTALDPALIALTGSCPYYQGRLAGSAPRTAYYRGSAVFGWEGVYMELPQVGALQPYATGVEGLIGSYFDRYWTWLEAMERAGLERSLSLEVWNAPLEAAWNPVRLTRYGTVEVRSMDSNLPDVVLSAVKVVYDAARRIVAERLTPLPAEAFRTLKVWKNCLLVPGFEYLAGELLWAAVSAGTEHRGVREYVDSVLKFAGQRNVPESTEQYILRRFAPDPTGRLREEVGLSLIRDLSARLEEQVLAPRYQEPDAELETGGSTVPA